MKGVLICLEGIDGAGKNTQAEMLAKRLGSDMTIRKYSYPDYKSRYGKIIREYLDKKIEMEMDEFFFLQVLDKQKDRPSIEKQLMEGEVLIMDRYVYSHIAYESAGGFDYEAAKEIVEFSKMPNPDIVIYLDVAADVSMERKHKQHSGKLDRLEAMSSYLNKVREVYDRLYHERYGTGNWIKIDASKNPAEIHEEIYMEVCKLLGV